MVMIKSDKVIAEEGCLHELFEVQADRRPFDLALICGQTRLSYQELEQRSNQLAHYLRANGVGPNKLVGLYLERSAEPIVAILATLKEGLAMCPSTRIIRWNARGISWRTPRWPYC